MKVWGWLLCAIIGGTGLGVIATHFSPQEGPFWAMPALYVAAFLFFYGLAAWAGFSLRTMLWKTAGRNEQSRTASRQGVLFGLMSVAILMLLAADFFNWWSAGLLFLIFVLLELYVR